MSKSEREKVGFEHEVPLGQLETVPDGSLAGVVGGLVSSIIAAVLLEPGVEVDTLNVTVSPECTDSLAQNEADLGGFEPDPDVLLIRAWAERDRRA